MIPESEKNTASGRRSLDARAFILLGMFLLTATFFYREACSAVYMNLGDGWWEYSLASFFKASISRGIFPLWNPDTGFGVPEWIVIGPLSLDRLLLFLMPPGAVWNVVKILNFVLSGWFLALFLLRRTRAFLLAFLGGLMVAVAQLNLEISFASYFLFILAFLFARRFVRERSCRSGAIFALALLAFFLNALPQPIFCATVFLFGYVAIRFGLHRRFELRAWLLACFPFFLVFMFFSPQMMRMKELLDLSARAVVADREVFSILPWDYLRMLWPNYTITSQDFTLNFIPDRLLAALQNRFLTSATVNFGQPPYYGILPFLAIACLLFKKNRTRFENRLLVFSGVMLFIPVVNPVLYPLLKQVPVLGVASGQSLFYAAYSHVLLLIVSLLTVLSLHYVSCSGTSAEFYISGLKKFFLVVAVMVAAAAVIRLLIYAAFCFDGESIRGLLNRWLSPHFAAGQFHQTPAFYSQRIAQASEFLRLWSSPGNAYFSMPVFLLLGSMAVLYARITRRIGERFFFISCIMLLLVDAAIFRPQSFYSVEDIAPFREEADFVKKDKGLFRVMALQDTSAQAADAAANDTRNVILRPETHLIYGLSSPECLRSLVIKDYAGYMSRMTAEGIRGRLVGEFGTIKDSLLLDLAGVKYLVAPRSKGKDPFPLPRYECVHTTRRCHIFENKFFRGRAFFLNAPGGSVTVEEYSPHSVRLDVKTDTPDELVLTDQVYPGWNAYVDGSRVPVAVFEGTFRKVAVPRGRHTVEFKYQPAYLMRGMIFPGLALLLWVWAFFGGRRRACR